MLIAFGAPHVVPVLIVHMQERDSIERRGLRNGRQAQRRAMVVYEADKVYASDVRIRGPSDRVAIGSRRHDVSRRIAVNLAAARAGRRVAAYDCAGQRH